MPIKRHPVPEEEVERFEQAMDFVKKATAAEILKDPRAVNWEMKFFNGHLTFEEGLAERLPVEDVTITVKIRRDHDD